MLNINFKVNKEILAREIISKSCMPKEFANYLWGKYRDSYRKVQKQVNSIYIDNEMLKELQEQPFFQVEIENAKQNCKRIETIWNINKTKINNFLEAILRTEIDLNTTAYIVSPTLNCGHNIGNSCFVWGHSQGLKDSNYDLVYLVHESLHSYFKNNNLCHAIIENISDVELSKYLNNSAKGYKYHDFTQEQHIKIYPYWNLYLNKTIDEIIKDQQITRINYDIYDIENNRQMLKNMNINELIEFLEVKTKTLNYETSYRLFF